MEKRLTPLKAIRAKCIDCSGEELKQVRECPLAGKQDNLCPIHALRMGKGGRATLKQIRTFCLWCCAEQRKEVKLCPSVKCPLWTYRFGKRLRNCLRLSEICTTEGVLESNLFNGISESRRSI